MEAQSKWKRNGIEANLSNSDVLLQKKIRPLVDISIDDSSVNITSRKSSFKDRDLRHHSTHLCCSLQKLTDNISLFCGPSKFSSYEGDSLNCNIHIKVTGEHCLQFLCCSFRISSEEMINNIKMHLQKASESCVACKMKT